MILQVAVSKINKYATNESGDTLEMVERPHGGVSFVMVDGQRSGRSAKKISNIVTRKAIGLLSEGVRDGAVARAAHDYLYTHRQGKVLATLNIVSVDLDSGSLVLCRNSHCPIYIITETGIDVLEDQSQPVGIYRNTKPVVTELPLSGPKAVIVFTDGVMSAGTKNGTLIDIPNLLQSIQTSGSYEAKFIADTLFEAAYALDDKRPTDDISLLVVSILDEEPKSKSRHLEITFPL